MNRQRRTWVVALVCMVSLLSTGRADAQVDPTSADAQELADRYAPIVVLKEQSGPCDSEGEPFAPTSVDIVLDNDDVLLRQGGVGDPVVRRGPVAADLHGRGDGFFLDFNGRALSPGCVYEQDFDSYAEGTDPVVYAHVVQQADKPDQLAVQYWLYWYFNDWNNTHESDWEFIQVLFDASTVSEALATEPVAVGYAQHEGGERAGWDSGKLERDGTRPVVYSSAGSHASYFSSATFLGRSGSEGFGCDTTVGPSVTTRPGVITLPDTADADDEFAWLEFRGRWGERQSGPFNGPTGPITKDQWSAPIDWHDDLRSSSVTIPGGEDSGDTILDTFCAVVEAGSNQLRRFQESPTQTIIALGALVVVGRLLVRRTTWSSVPAAPLRQRRSTGQMVRGAFEAYWTSRGAMTGIALAYLPAALLVGIMAAIDLEAGQATAAFLTAVMLFLATALISAIWHLASVDGSRTQAFVDAGALVRKRLRPLIGTVLLAAIIVIGLTMTIVGIPWAIRQTIRYQFTAPVVVTEGLSGTAALDRGTDLVRGRWWRTAITVLLFSGLAVLINSTLQLVMLIVLSGIPLWAYVSVSFVGIGLVIPLIAIPPILLYGDAATRFDDPDPSSAVDRSSGVRHPMTETTG